MHTIKNKHIQRIVAAHYGIEPGHITSKSRMTEHVRPRWVAMYLCRCLTEASYPDIAHNFGGCNHTTVMNAVDKTDKLLKRDQELSHTIETLKALITGEQQKKEQGLIERLQRKIERLEALFTEIRQELEPIKSAIPEITKLNEIFSQVAQAHDKNRQK